jgi:hypothetical protein
MNRFLHFLLISGLLLLGACQKTGNSDDNNPDPSANRLSYGDTLFFNHNLTTDKLITVVSTPSATVKYKAIPGGLLLDSVTGRINLSKSESGIRYKVFAVNAAGIAIDSVKLVISGIDYADGIYNINATPIAYDTAFPIYNARPELLLPCNDDDDDDDDDDSTCVFDETDLDNDGNDDIAGIIQDKLLVNTKTGTLDLEASFRAGLFGSSQPANGTLKEFVMYYRLNDASSRALQKINLKIYYYQTENDIPLLLKNELNIRGTQVQNINARLINSAEFATYERPKRPPILIIVGRI